MKIYLVGGAVRDRLLNIPVKDRDWLVVGATEGQMLELGYQRQDGTFPVFRHPETGEEYALARREVKSGTGYKGFEVEYGPDVTLEEDLQRRDFTVNALVQDEDGQVIDRVGGLADIEARRLKHISPAFVEDPVRLLRAARFVARLSKYGFSLAHDTFKLMKEMATPEEITALKPERVWQEMRRALAEPEPWRFFETLQRCGVLKQLLPNLSLAMSGDLAHGSHEPAESITILKRAVAAGAEPEVRFVAMFTPLCKGPGGCNWLSRVLPLERAYLEPLKQLQGLARFYPAAAAGDAAATLDLLVRGRVRQQPRRFAELMQACALVWPQLAPDSADWFSRATEAMNSVSPAGLSKEGLQGPDLGRALRERQIAAIDALVQPLDQ